MYKIMKLNDGFNSRYSALALAIFSVLVIVMGLSVIVGWYTNNRLLIQIMPDFVPMQYNTALCFVLSGIGLMSQVLKSTKSSLVVGLLLTIISTMTLIEYMFLVNFGIDQLFMKHYITIKTSHAGRMAPNTAFCFALTGISLILLSLRNTGIVIRTFIEILGTLVIINAVIAVFGYVIGSSIGYSWGNFSMMAVHTSTGFVIVGLGIIISTDIGQKTLDECYALWQAILLSVLVAIVVIYNSLDISVRVIYIPLVFCSLFFRMPTISFILASVASLLTILGYFSSLTLGGENVFVVTDRVLSLFGIWFVAIMIFFHKRTQQQLEERSGRLNTILKMAPDGILSVDMNGIIRSVNESILQIFGYKEKQLIGQNIEFLIPKKYHQQHKKDVSKYAKMGKAKVMASGREVYGVGSDGQQIPLEIGLSRTIMPDKSFEVVATVRNISERKEAELEKENLVQKLIESNAELEKFAYVASHDLQEPLRMVRNFTGLLKKRYEDQLDEDGKKYIDISYSAAARMQDLVEDLLEYARIGEESEQYKDINSNKILEYVLANLKENIRGSQAKITYKNLPSFHGNPVRFSRVLQNLIGNGLKYQPKDNVPEINISAEDKGDKWLFLIEDNGIGMKPEYCEQIFQPFKRLHGKGEYSGTGMGLSICRKIIENLGGKIWAESEEGKGSKFYLTVPKDVEIITRNQREVA